MSYPTKDQSEIADEHRIGRVSVTDLKTLHTTMAGKHKNLRGLVLRGNELFATFATAPKQQELDSLAADTGAKQ